MTEPTREEVALAGRYLALHYQQMTPYGARIRTRLIDAYGVDVARDIVTGNLPAANRDLARWRRLGTPDYTVKNTSEQ